MIYPFPISVPAADLVDVFLERSIKRGVTSIDILLLGYETRLNEGGSVPIIEVPLGISYRGRDKDNRIVLVRSIEYLQSAYYSPSDTEFRDPLGIIPRPDPWKKLEEYGLSCAKYCAARNFKTRIFLRRPPISTGSGNLISQISPDEVDDPETTRIPLFLMA